MVPIPESSYFPPLDKCLTGEQLLISWKTVFLAITNNDNAPSDQKSAIDQFLSDPEVLDRLSKPFDAFPQPSQATKTAFEQKTSAINVTPSSSPRYEIKEIKEDALWLSKIANIDELSALRVVIEECQSRTAAQLLGRFSEEELISIGEAAGNSKYSSPIPVCLLSEGLDLEAIQKDFDLEDNRRQRIFRAYLSERRHLLKSTERLLHIVLNPDQAYGNGTGKATEVKTSWLASHGRTVASKLGPTDDFLLRCFKAIRGNVKNIENGSGWQDDVELEWVRAQITEATHSMEIVFQMVDSARECTSSKVVLEWLRLADSCGFFSSFEMEEPSVQALLLPLQSLTTIISLTVFSLGSCIAYLSDARESPEVSTSVDVPYIFNSLTMADIHSILTNAAEVGLVTAGPAILAWSALLQTLRIRITDSKAAQLEGYPSDSALAPVIYEDVVEQIMDSREEDPIDFLARRAVNLCHVFETLSGLSQQLGNTSNSPFTTVVGAKMRIAILDLIRCTTAVGYIPEVIETTLSSLSGGQNYWDLMDCPPLQKANDPIATFLEDEELITALLKNAMSRYPYESIPFLQMIRILATSPHCYDEGSNSLAGLLENIPVFTFQLPNDFMDYETTQEEENNNTIRLTRPIHLFEPRSKALGYQRQSDSLALTKVDKDFCIVAGTCGRIISDSDPKVALWFHEYSGLKYLGKLLETFLAASDQVDGTTGMPADRNAVSEIIGIFANLLLGISKSAMTKPEWKDEAVRTLETASSGLNRNRDIITVVFDIFEEELQRQSNHSGSDVPLDVLVSCIHFIHAMISISPGRVWPLLARSGLLGVGHGDGRLSTIVESVELVSGRYDLLLSCCHLYEALVEDFAANAVRRRSGSKSSARFVNGEDIRTGIPDQVLSKILLSFTRYLVDVLESSCTWKFAVQDDRRHLSRIIGATFDKILIYTYGIESTSNSVKMEGEKEKTAKIMQALAPSASHLVETFLSASSGTLRFQPLLRSYYDGLETPEFTAFMNLLSLWTAQVNAILAFSKNLLRVSALLDRPTSQLEKQLFKASPLIARLYAASDAYRTSVVVLFEALIVAASSNNSEPPSLLGHLGPQTAKNFLHILSDLDKPLSREKNVLAIWHFLSMVVSNRQQWFANYLLTGKTPRDALQNKTSGKDLAALDKALLTTALESLSSIQELPKTQALAMLEFVALSQNFWPWIVYGSQKHADFIKSISEFVGTVPPIQKSTNLEANLEACYQTRIAAYIAEILAMHLFHTRQTGTSSSVKDLLPNLSYFARFAAAVPTYNSSLHAQLKLNFEARYPGCTLRDLKRTSLENRQIGKDYFYDLPLADKMLSLDQAWTGRKNDGLRAEFTHANVNLSMVDSQIALFQGWRYLAIELSSNLSSEIELQKMLAKVSTECLVANQKSQLPEEIFTRLSQARADFALILNQRLIEAKSNVLEMKNHLTTTWETIRTLRGSFERAVSNGDADYYRSLLKLLFLALRVHADDATAATENLRASLRITQSSPIIPTLLDILKYVVAIGLREIASSIHENAAESTPEDIALLTGILQSILRIPGIELCHSQIVSLFSGHSTARVATTLFSWSDSLAINGDPIYGELSILFLLELSSMPLMAEQLAIDGLLGHIASANITSYLRRGNVSPFADSAGLQRCYSIWVKGILPLLLNLLHSVQGNIASEVAIFLNQFPTLLSQASSAFDAPETSRILSSSKHATKYISLSTCSEVHSIALITYILSGYRDGRGQNVVVDVKQWDAGQVQENVDFWLGSRALLRERILPMGEREVEMLRRKVQDPMGNGQVSELEARVVGEMMGNRDVLGGD